MPIKLLKILGVLLLAIAGVLLFNTFTLSSKQIEVETIEKIEVSDEVISRFQGALRFPTISNMDSTYFDSTHFINQIKYVKETYPLVDSLLTLNIVGGYTMLFKWEGSDLDLRPGLLYSHYDVVPVDSATMNDWEAAPFAGVVKNGNIYGRGALDDKSGVFGTLEALELLLNEGFQPERTLYYGFGHDEEIGGTNGAGSIVRFFERKKIRLEFSLDEGIPIIQGMIPGIEKPMALISTAEKGYVSYRITVKTNGGHSSSPTPDNTIGSLARAIVDLEENQFNYDLVNPIDQQIAYLGAEMPFISKVIFANTWLFGKPILKQMNAHTTTAATMLEGGIKDNVIPTTASVVVNFRIMPGVTVDDVYNHIVETIDDNRFTVEKFGEGTSSSPVASIESYSYLAINRTLRQVFGDIVVSPALMPAGTDSKHFVKIADDSYRFNPAKITSIDEAGFHGTNEHLSVDSYKWAIRFYYQFIKNTSSK